MSGKVKGVRATHKEYDELSPVWERCSDAVDGQRAIHKARTAYLAKLKDEDEDGYCARLGRSDFFNATWRTISGLVGMAFRKEPTAEVPTAIEPFLDDIDLAGTSLNAMAKDLVEDVLEYGRIGIMVDHPERPANVTALSKSAAEQLGLRPTLQVYGAESIINWRYGRVNGSTVLTMVVLKECELIQVSEFEAKEEDRYRVLDLDETGVYRQRVFRIDDKGNDELVSEVFPMMNGKPMPFVPFYIIGANGIATETDEPPLIDLVDANIAHYQLNSDYRHGLHFTGLPTPWVSGYAQDSTNPASFYIGSKSAWVFPDPQAKVGFLEFSGQGLNALKEAIAALEQRMAILGARMIADETSQVETLGATQIKRQGENSVLSAIVIAVSAVIEKALGVMSEWAGGSGPVVFKISREFMPVPMTAQDLTALVGAWQNGALSEAELFDLFKRGDLIDGGKALDEHQAEVEITAPAPVKPAMPGSMAA